LKRSFKTLFWGSHDAVTRGVAADTFPTAPQRFDVLAALTNGFGDVPMTFSVLHLETNQELSPS
jgi:hypothetical protein